MPQCSSVNLWAPRHVVRRSPPCNPYNALVLVDIWLGRFKYPWRHMQKMRIVCKAHWATDRHPTGRPSTAVHCKGNQTPSQVADNVPVPASAVSFTASRSCCQVRRAYHAAKNEQTHLQVASNRVPAGLKAQLSERMWIQRQEGQASCIPSQLSNSNAALPLPAKHQGI